MYTEIIDLRDHAAREEYESFAGNHPRGNFMQSLAWAGIKDNWDSAAIVARGENRAVVGSMLLLIKKIGSAGDALLYAPRGPVCSDGAVFLLLKEAADAVARERGISMLRIDPELEEQSSAEILQLTKCGFLHRPRPAERTTIQNRKHYLLDIEGRGEEEIFAGFHQKWRYNIRLAERKGVRCGYYGAERLEDFYRLFQETGARDGFAIREISYYQKVLAEFGSGARLYIADWNGIPLCGALVVQYAGRISYLYGASSGEHRNLMPNHLMQWRMIQWAIESGCRIYDFMGIPYYDRPDRREYGVYRFKQGFGGRIVTYAGEFDFPYRKLYAGVLRWAIAGEGRFGAMLKTLVSQNAVSA